MFLTYIIIKSRHILGNVNSLLNFAAIILCSISIFRILIITAKDDLQLFPIKNYTLYNSSSYLYKKICNRDIYYIILDGYASDATLKNFYGYNNKEFTDYLLSKGFVIASGSHSNYMQTHLSLSSSLNMKYLDVLSGKASKNPDIPNIMIHKAGVVSYLKKKGYKFINYSSGWGATRHIPYSDIEYDYGVTNELYCAFIRSTVLRFIEDKLIYDDQRNRILLTLKGLSNIPSTSGPKFIFAHIVCPHPPFFFGQHGEHLTVLYDNSWTEKQKYKNQLIFINHQVEAMISQILKKPGLFPIIIIQSDHGPASTIKNEKNWENPNNQMINERTSIINAYYLPSIDNNAIYNTITPVNTFRVIFNIYFNAQYKLLPDMIYFSSPEHPYFFLDVTSRINN